MTSMPLLAEVVDGLRLGRVEVAGRHDVRAAAPQRQQQRRRLGLEVDAGPDAQPLERLRPLELVAGRLEQPRAVGDPLEARHQRTMNPMTTSHDAGDDDPAADLGLAAEDLHRDRRAGLDVDRRPPRHAS